VAKTLSIKEISTSPSQWLKILNIKRELNVSTTVAETSDHKRELNASAAVAKI
jgi:hypothetical protein